MLLFEAISPEEVRVHVNYFEAEMCYMSPFRSLRGNAEAISSIIDVQELISLLSPPLRYKERLAVLWSIVVYAVAMFTVVGCTIDFRHKDQNFQSIALGVLSVVAFELTFVVLLDLRFGNKLARFIDSLNRNMLHRRGVHLYYIGGLCGKNARKLGIRRHHESSIAMDG